MAVRPVVAGILYRLSAWGGLDQDGCRLEMLNPLLRRSATAMPARDDRLLNRGGRDKEHLNVVILCEKADRGSNLRGRQIL